MTTQQEVQFDPNIKISDSVKHLIKQLLCVDPNKRLSAR